MTTRRAIATAVAATFTVTCLAAGAAWGADPPDLSGRWKLNPDLSEDPREKMRESMGGRGGGSGMGGGKGGGMGGGIGGGMGGGRGGGSRSGGGGEGDRREQMQELEASLESLEIVQNESIFRLLMADDREVAYSLAGDATFIWSPHGEIEAKARWKKERLVVELTGERGDRVETWELGPDGRQLFVTVKMKGDGRMPKVEFQRVYDLDGTEGEAVPDAAPEAAAPEIEEPAS